MTGPGYIARAVEKAARAVVNYSAGDRRPMPSDLCQLDLYCLRWLESRGRLAPDTRMSARPPRTEVDAAWLGTGNAVVRKEQH